MPTRILIADDHAMFRAGLRALLTAQPDMQVVAEAGDGRSAVGLAEEHKPDAVIMDMGMPDLNGIDATRQCAALEGVKVLALSAHGEERRVREALRAGASGYLLKEAAFTELATAIRAIVAGKTYRPPRIAPAVALAGDGEDASAFSTLTAREREVVQLLAEGRATKQVAAELRVSVKTVETHRGHVMDKLNIDSVAELTKYAIREGLTSLHP